MIGIHEFNKYFAVRPAGSDAYLHQADPSIPHVRFILGRAAWPAAAGAAWAAGPGQRRSRTLGWPEAIRRPRHPVAGVADPLRNRAWTPAECRAAGQVAALEDVICRQLPRMRAIAACMLRRYPTVRSAFDEDDAVQSAALELLRLRTRSRSMPRLASGHLPTCAGESWPNG